MKFNLIYRLKYNEIGSGITAIYMADTYPDLFQSINYANEDLPKNNRIWRLQNPYFYKTSCVDRINDYVMIRKQFTNIFPGKHLVDGYSYYRQNISQYQAWFPTIYQSYFECNDIPSIGYYARDCRMQSNLAFINFIEKLPHDIPIITMGTKSCIEKYLINNPNWKHTYNNKEFWKKCSHYFYYRCSDFEDPFPQNLLEAIQSKHRIISPKDIFRKHIDGIDDFLSCIEFDEKFIEDNIGVECELLQSNIWKKYITELVESKFSRNHIIYKEHNNLLYDWICKFLI